MADGYELTLAQGDAFARGVGRTVVRVEAPGWDATAVGEGVARAVASFEVLRTSFDTAPGTVDPLQVVHDDPGPAVVGNAVRDAEVSADLTAPAQLSVWSDPLDPRNSLLFAVPDVVADHRSLCHIADVVLGRAAPDPDSVQVADVAGWESEQTGTDAPERRAALTWWAEHLAAGHGRPPPAPNAPAGAVVAVAGGSAPSPADDATWLLAWTTVLRRHDLLAEDGRLAVAVPGRSGPELVGAVGPFERRVDLRCTADLDAPAAAGLDLLRRDLERADRAAIHAPRAASPLGIRFLPPGSVPTDWPGTTVSLQVVGGIDATVTAPRGRPSTADRLVEHLLTVVAALRATPETAPAAVTVVGDAEQAELAGLQDGGPVPAGGGTVVEAFVRACRDDPDAVVVADARTRLTAREVDDRRRVLAAGLARVLPPGREAVGVLVDRTVDTVVAALAVMSVGRAYQPVEPGHPAPRVAAQLAAGGCVAVVRPAGDTAPGTSYGVTELTHDALRAAAPGAVVAPGWDDDADPDGIAYQISTSGSTGTPKVVAVRHRNAVAYARAVGERCGIGASDRLGAVTSLSTDLASTALLPALVLGARVRLLAEDESGDLDRLAGVVIDEGLTVLKLTASHLRALLADPGPPLPLDLLVVGGEQLDRPTVAAARARGVRRVVNHYGPTETTVGAITHETDAASDAEPGPVPIGRALPGVRTRVLDPYGHPVPRGATGELVVAGAGVGAGYVGAPEATAARFATVDGEPDPVFRTGDLVRLDDAGRLTFVGRADGQVKIRGYRVELDDIAATVRAHAAVAEAVAVVDPADSEADRIVVYAVSGAAVAPAEAELVEYAARRLPSHMVPGRVLLLTSLPRTASGKIDRRDLAARVVPAPDSDAVEAPAGATETALLAIWSDVLELDRLGVTDDFFLVGGHSLLATRIMARARAQFEVDLPLHLIFSHSTVRALAAEIDARTPASVPGEGLDDTLAAAVDAMSDDEVARMLEQLGGAADREP